MGDLCCSSSYDVLEHEQAYLEFSYIESGKALFKISKNTFIAEPGNLILTRPGDVHRITSLVDDPVRYFYFAIIFREEHPDFERLRDMKKFFDTTPKRILENAMTTYQAFYKMFNEINTNNPFSAEMIESCLTDILITFYRGVNNCTESRYLSRNNKHTEDELVYSVIDVLNSNANSLKNLSELGQKIGYSYPYLSQIFSQKMGQSIRDYYRHLLFEKAIGLLNNNISITRIAETLGYDSIHSFSRAFTKYYGVSPSKYIEQHGNGNTKPLAHPDKAQKPKGDDEL